MNNDAKEEIRAKLAIEEVIGEYVQLKRSGRYWKGLSPFTNERTPSFFVTPDRDIWHDFSSGKGGDIFSFIMEMEGLDFRGALELLARKAGVDLSKYQSGRARDNAQRKERYFQMNNLAVNYYQRQLVRSTKASDYANKKRRLSRETILEWGIGYAPERPDLTGVLTRRNYHRDEMKQAGLLGYSGRELFFNRLMIPLRDRRGQVVGFTGRIIGVGEPKYLNTPDTLLFHKGQQLFGLSFAAQAIRQAGYSVIVEGNLDVITSHQAGIKNVVGVAGTALTVEHLKSLSRLSSDIRFCFDSDKAGVAATEKAIKLAGSLELKLSVIDYSGSSAKDPDELIRQDPALWQQALTNYQPAVNWVRDYYLKTIGVDTVEGQKKVADRTLSVISSLADPVEREGYIKELSAVVGISVSSLVDRLKMLQRGSTSSRRQLKQPRTKANIAEKRRFNYLDPILAYLGSHADLRSKYLRYLPDEQLPGVDQLVKQWLSLTELWGDGLIDRVTEAMEQPGAELDQLDQVRTRLVQLMMVNDQAGSTIDGIKSEDDLLEYICYFERDYYLLRAKQLTSESMADGVAEAECSRLMTEATKARRLAERLSPSRNRRNGYAGLKEVLAESSDHADSC